MSLFDRLPQHHGSNLHRDGEIAVDATLPRSFPVDDLARGVVWANVLADIAADDRARELAEAA